MATGNQAGAEPTIIAPDTYRNVIEMDAEWYNVDVIDISIDENSKKFAENIQKCDGFLITYSITSKDSFDAISSIYNKVKRIKKDDAQFLLIGNKVDFKNDREVLYETGTKNLLPTFF